MSDLIKREDVMALWEKYHPYIAVKAIEFGNGLKEIPSTEPVKHGKWTITPSHIECSECGESFMLFPSNYCPNCGARMDK